MGQVSIIGCGIMGRTVIRTLARHGKELVIWNRTPAKAHALAQPGITVAESFTNALTASPVIIFILADPEYAAATALLQQNSTHIAGKTIVQLSTGTPTDARKLNEIVIKMGGSYLDGAIMVTPDNIGTPKSLILYSGERAAFMTLESTFLLLGPPTFQADDAGAAAILEMAFNVAAAPTLVALLQGIKICELEKIPPQLYADLIKESFVDYIVSQVERGVRDKTQGSKEHEEQEETIILVEQITIILGNYLKSLNIDAGMFDALARLFAGGIASGYGDHDLLCVADLHAINT